VGHKLGEFSITRPFRGHTNKKEGIRSLTAEAGRDVRSFPDREAQSRSTQAKAQAPGSGASSSSPPPSSDRASERRRREGRPQLDLRQGPPALQGPTSRPWPAPRLLGVDRHRRFVSRVSPPPRQPQEGQAHGRPRPGPGNVDEASDLLRFSTKRAAVNVRKALEAARRRRGQGRGRSPPSSSPSAASTTARTSSGSAPRTAAGPTRSSSDQPHHRGQVDEGGF
jgi:hypothetical protein